MIKGIFAIFVLVLGFAPMYAGNENTLTGSTETRSQSEIIASTVPTVFPKLLWEKKLSKPITASAISKDGTKIAIADETGYLTVYNANGEKLWEYHYKGDLPKRTDAFKSDKAEAAILNIKFSGSGKFIVCDLGILSALKYGNTTGYKPYKKLCFNMDASLLWQTSKQGDHIIGGDKYVLIRRILNEDEYDYSPPIDYYVLDMTGKYIFTGKTIGQENDCQGFSEDARYMFVDNKLIECENWKLVWEFKEKDGRAGKYLGIRGNLILVSSGGMKIRVYDIATRKMLLDIGENFFTYLTDNYVTGLRMNYVKKNFVLCVSEVKTGNVILMHQYESKDIKWCSKLLLHTANDERHLLLGTEKSILFYDIKNGKSWELPVEVRECSFFNYYSVSDNENAILIGYDRSVKLYKSF